MENNKTLVAGTGSSLVVDNCQVCSNPDLDPILFVGYLPPVNLMLPINSQPQEQPAYPAQWLSCPNCHLVQLGLIVDPQILFPASYPYTSSTTKILRENFAELYKECRELIEVGPDDLVVDIGSNDGNLLSNFADAHRVQGITPEDIGNIAIERGIPTLLSYFDSKAVAKIVEDQGRAKVVTITNAFAHIENIHDIVEGIIELMTPDGVFISESHYLASLIETLQYDTIYHEHLRYYSVHSLNHLLNMHDLEIFHVKRIPTHGGSIRVYASRKGKYTKLSSVDALMVEEEKILDKQQLLKFKERVVLSKLELHALLLNLKKNGHRIYGIGAPSRASTLINYAGIDDGIVDYVLEIKGSYKIGNYVPGTLIPIIEESKLFDDQPDYALLFSWHIADELAPKLKEKGFKGDFIIPLPPPRILRGSEV